MPANLENAAVATGLEKWLSGVEGGGNMERLVKGHKLSGVR